MRNAVRPCYTSANGPHLRRLGQQLPWDLDPDWKGSSVFQHVWQGLDGHPYSLISMQAEDVLARPTRSGIPTPEHPAPRGFTLVEVLVSVAIAGITLAALYSGFASCLLIERHTEESTRAVAILRERLELVRLYPWSHPGARLRTRLTSAVHSPTTCINPLTAAGRVRVSPASSSSQTGRRDSTTRTGCDLR